MIVNERIVAYINSLDRGNSPICNTIEKEAIEDDVPIIRKEMGNLLKVLLELKQPQSILVKRADCIKTAGTNSGGWHCCRLLIYSYE